jgi:hypothetical protein
MITIHAYVVRGQSYDVVMGSSEFRIRHANIDYDTCTTTFALEDRVITIPFSIAQSETQTMPLYATTAVEIKPGEHVINVFAPTRSQPWRQFKNANDYDTNPEHQGRGTSTAKISQWGMVTGSGHEGTMVQTMKMDLVGSQAKVRVFNYTSKTIQIKRLERMAVFTPGDSNYYNIIENATETTAKDDRVKSRGDIETTLPEDHPFGGTTIPVTTHQEAPFGGTTTGHNQPRWPFRRDNTHNHTCQVPR